MCKHIAVKAHPIPLDVTGKHSIIYIANTDIGVCSISKCFVENYPCLKMFGRYTALGICTLQYPAII